MNDRTRRRILVLGAAAAALFVVAVPVIEAQTDYRFQFPFGVRTNNAGASLFVRQDGSGSIATFRDGATNEYTFDQSSATFANHLNLSDDLTIGNGTADVTQNGEDAYVEGTFEVDGASRIDGAVDLNGAITNAAGLEHIGFPTWVTTAFTYTAAAGGTVPLATIGAGETWIVHGVWLDVTSNFNCTGDDCVMVIGDGNDADGFCVLADAELQSADTEGTGWSAGWQCQVAATRGVYQDGTGGFVYDEASTETIDAVMSASGNDFSAGAATAHILYTRIQ